MFIIELSYKAPNDQIDQQVAPHRAFFDKYYAAGKFIASGPKIPRDGGIILANAASKEEIADIIREDPFHINGLSDYRVIEFSASKRSERAGDLIR